MSVAWNSAASRSFVGRLKKIKARSLSARYGYGFGRTSNALKSDFSHVTLICCGCTEPDKSIAKKEHNAFYLKTLKDPCGGSN